jgi:hypothetical protein
VWALVVALFGVLLARPVSGATIMVVNTANSGPGSLRQAMLDANDETSNPGTDIVAFDIPGSGVPKITVTTELPAITAPLAINGTTQQPAGRVELSGGGAVANGLVVNSSGSTIRGLVINGFVNVGVSISADDTIVRGCIVGLNPAANAIPSPQQVGILVGGGARTRIGGTTLADRNIVSGNFTRGIWLTGSGTLATVIEGNFIGTNAAGLGSQLGNGEGIAIDGGARDSRIGGVNPGSRNVIAANGPSLNGAGLRLQASGTQGNVIQNNHIGVDPTGTIGLANGIGVVVDQAVANVVAENLISGNNTSGIDLKNVGGEGNIVRGNRIGTKADAIAALPNGAAIRIMSSNGTNLVGGTAEGTRNLIAFNGSGITITSSSNQSIQGNRIGVLDDGTAAANAANGIRIASGSSNRIGDLAGNHIAYNGSASFPAGVLLQGGTKNTVRGNAIHDNLGLGLDLAPAGVTPNDAGDGDSGANDLTNFPILDPALLIEATSASGTLDAVAATAYTIDVYLSDACDASGNGEGGIYVGSVEATTDGTGHAAFVVSLSQPTADGDVLTATATDAAGNTSEFSPCTSPATPTTTTIVTTTTIETTSTTGLGSTTTVRTTTTSTTIFRPPPPTLPPELCEDQVDNDGDGFVDCADIQCFGQPACVPQTCGSELTLAAVICRVDTERGTLAAAVDLGPTVAPARGRLDKARSAVVGGQAACSLRKVGPARRRLAQASRLVKRAEAQLRKRGSKAGVPAERIESLAGGLSPLRTDLTTLRGTLSCP